MGIHHNTIYGLPLISCHHWLEINIKLICIVELSRAENEDQERESLDAGNDPDGVAEGIPADNGAAFDRQPSLKHDGPVAPLIDSTSDLELNSVALTPDQVSFPFHAAAKFPSSK